jgi:AcrR family transcriptional regulator
MTHRWRIRAKRGWTPGRPRSFDPDEALDAILRLFAAHGYEGVTLPMMEEATGLSRPSLYWFFGPKDEVFVKAIDLHASRSAMMSPENVGRVEPWPRAFKFRHSAKRRPQICLGMIGSKSLQFPPPNVITGQSPARDNYLLIVVP